MRLSSMAHTARELVITRDVRYEIRLPADGNSNPPAVELHDMEIVNDSGQMIFIEDKQ